MLNCNYVDIKQMKNTFVKITRFIEYSKNENSSAKTTIAECQKHDKYYNHAINLVLKALIILYWTSCIHS